jgi:hypothetical protein
MATSSPSESWGRPTPLLLVPNSESVVAMFVYQLPRLIVKKHRVAPIVPDSHATSPIQVCQAIDPGAATQQGVCPRWQCEFWKGICVTVLILHVPARHGGWGAALILKADVLFIEVLVVIPRCIEL